MLPDYSKTYSTLVVQPIDLINAYKLDFCFASVIKWLTKWQMENKSEYITKARYYVTLCESSEVPASFLFALRMYCLVNGFIKSLSGNCLLITIADLVANKRLDYARGELNKICL